MPPVEDRSEVAAVILAAGLGRRFGGPKAGARLRGQTLLAHVVARARGAGLKPVIAVILDAVDVPPDVVAVVNPRPEHGLSSSLQLGIAAVPPGMSALVLLVDQPTLAAESIADVLTARGTRPILAAESGGRLAPPVLLEPEAFPLVAALAGDIGLRGVFRRNPELVHAVSVPGHAPDIDTTDDLARVEAG
ncbi:MAG: nucleotidyltransferase family protein [Candidatus Limnocylindria bacterium]